MDKSENVTDSKGEILISYLDSPDFIKASANAVRLVSKLKVAVQKQELYETHQILRTIYFRFVNNKDKIESLVGLLYHGAQYLLDNLETISGQDIATLYLESSSKYLQSRLSDSMNLIVTQSESSHPPINNALETDICHKISNLLIKLPDGEMGQAKFTAEALGLLNPKILNRDLLHTVIASRYWQEKNYVNARYHYLHCASLDNAQDIAMLLVDYHVKSANKAEIDLFITQFIFQFLCLQNPFDSIRTRTHQQRTIQNPGTASSLAAVTRKSRNAIKLIAEKIFSTYTLKHPQLSRVEVPFSSLPLLNFTFFIISILDSNEINTFKMLCDIYKTTWSRDPNYQSYLNRIGVLYFGQSDHSRQHQQQGSFFNNILMSLLEGADEQGEADSNLGGNNSSSSDELD